MFKNYQLHGLGKRINPNQIIQQGHFDNGYHIEQATDFTPKTNIHLPKKVNFNEYFSCHHHINVFKNAIPHET